MRVIIKKIFNLIVIFIVFMTFICTFKLNVNANEVNYDVKIESGASLRTTGERQGIKFTANVNTLDGVLDHGFYVAKGNYTKSEMLIEANENQKKISLRNGTYCKFNLIIYGMNSTDDYLSDLTVLAYVTTTDQTFYSDVVTRNIAEVAVGAKNYGYTADLITNITNDVFKTYKAYYIENYKVNITSNPSVNDIEFVKIGETIKLPFIEKIGNTFSCWKCDSSVYAANDSFKVTSNDVLLESLWTLNEYTITFDTVGGSAIEPITAYYGWPITMPALPVKEDAVFAGWDVNIPATMPAENLVITAIWNDSKVTLTFMSNGEIYKELSGSVGDEIVEPSNPYRNGYSFVGWDKEIPTVFPESDLVIDALWKLNTYYISYYVNGEFYVSNSYTIEDTVTLLTFEEENGYIFDGWYNNKSLDGNKITNFYHMTGNYNFYCYYAMNQCIYVDDSWIDKNDGDVVIYNNNKYIIGKNAFSSITSALENITDRDMVYVLSGTYNENFTIDNNNITFIGPNSDINGRSERKDEAIITGIISLSGDIKNFSINGFKFIDNSQINVITSDTNLYKYTCNGITFTNNYVDKGKSTNSVIYLNGGDNYFRNIKIDNCYFTANSLTDNELIAIYNVTDIGGLIITNSVFENISANAVSLYDTTNRAGLRSNLTVENNIFKNINGSAIWINYTNYVETYRLFICDNNFESVYGDACITFYMCGQYNNPNEFTISTNIFKDVYRILYTVVDGATFKDNVVYLYNGTLEDSYVINADKYSDRPEANVICEGNVYLSIDESTAYVTPSVSGFKFVGNVTGFDSGNYESFEHYTARNKIFRLTFDTDGGTSIGTMWLKFEEKIFKPVAPVKEGYKFIGWSEEIPDTMPSHNMTIKALWEKIDE